MKFIKLIKASNDMAKNHLRWLVYQVNNGGVSQYCGNGYADDLLDYIKGHNIIKELQEMNCPQEGINAIEQMIKCLEDHLPYADCMNCDGTGELEDWDEEEGLTDMICETCRGDGYIEKDKWVDTDEQSWMNRYDNWFYKLDMDKLDDWTEQSHTHSVVLDMINQNKAIGDN